MLIIYCIIYRSLISNYFEDYALLTHLPYDRWIRSHSITSESLKRISESYFYFELAQNLRLVITDLIRLECHCAENNRSSIHCNSCILLYSTGVDNSKLVLNKYLKIALHCIDFIQLYQDLSFTLKKIDTEHLKNLCFKLWRTRSETRLLIKNIQPYFGLRVFDKRTCIYNLVNSISTTCEFNGSTKL